VRPAQPIVEEKYRGVGKRGGRKSDLTVEKFPTLRREEGGREYMGRDLLYASRMGLVCYACERGETVFVRWRATGASTHDCEPRLTRLPPSRRSGRERLSLAPAGKAGNEALKAQNRNPSLQSQIRRKPPTTWTARLGEVRSLTLAVAWETRAEEGRGKKSKTRERDSWQKAEGKLKSGTRVYYEGERQRNDNVRR